MEVIGDLERAFAAWIYPNRALVAVGAILVALGVLVVARRRRWDLVARRHPWRAASVLAVAALVLGPTGWYLGSPLILSTTIDEPPPVAAGSPSAAFSTATPAHLSTLAPTLPPGSASPSVSQRVGTFAGADEFHFGAGTARLIETAPGSFTLRLEDFAVRNGPDLFVYLSRDPRGSTDGAIDLGPLKADRGNQNYAVPPGVDVGGVGSVVIWCRQFSVLFASAALS